MNKKIWLPIIAIAVCIVVIVTVLALTLSPKDETGKHIQPEENGAQVVEGELDISLMRERLETLTLDESGMPVRGRNETLTDFSRSKDNIFGIDRNILIGPGCYFTAEMTIANKEPYPFEYWLEITPDNGDSLLVDQLELTVVVNGEIFIQRTLQSGLETKVFPKVKSGDTAQFTVSLKYLDVHNNDETKNTTLAFDMIVHARLTES